MGNGNRWDAIVIGAGVNGLTAAVVLARAGKRVLVVERSPAAGGQTALHEFAPGFRTAPLGLRAGWLSPAVARAAGISAPKRTVPEFPVSAAVPQAGSGAGGPSDWLRLSRDPAVAAEAIRRYSAADASKWTGFCEQLHQLGGFLEALYQLAPPDIEERRLTEILPILRLARRLRGLGRKDMIELLRLVPMPVQELLDDWFESARLKAAVGTVGVTGIRQGPRSGGTGFVLLHQLAGAPLGAIGAGGGEGYWTAGPPALTEALVTQARRLQVEIRTGTPVIRIVVQEDRAGGVLLESGEELQAPLVLSSADPARTLLSLIDPVWLDPDLLLAVRNIKFRGSTSVLSYALDGQPGLSDALTGALVLTASLEELERAADAAKYGRVSERPLVTVRMPSIRWPGFAPPGKHVLVAEVQWTPAVLPDGGWDRARREALERAVRGALDQAVPGFTGLVREVEVLTPPDLESRYGLTEGAPSHGELTLDQILFMRPVPGLGRYATPVDGLYLCGAGTHPGPGIAGAPGWLAARTAVRGER